MIKKAPLTYLDSITKLIKFPRTPTAQAFGMKETSTMSCHVFSTSSSIIQLNEATKKKL